MLSDYKFLLKNKIYIMSQCLAIIFISLYLINLFDIKQKRCYLNLNEVNKISHLTDFKEISKILENSEFVLQIEDVSKIFNKLKNNSSTSMVKRETFKLYELVYKAKYSENIWNKLQYLENAIQEADLAVRKYPFSKEIRKARYIIHMNIPKLFSKKQVILEDELFIKNN